MGLISTPGEEIFWCPKMLSLVLFAGITLNKCVVLRIMHHSLVSMALPGRDVGAGNIAGLKWRTLKSALSLQCLVPARFLIPHLSAKRIFGFTCEDLSRGFARF